MYTIIMNNKKTLIASGRINLYENDNLADKLRFLFPQTYKDISLNECIVRINYMDINGEEISEILERDEVLYKNRLSYRYPVDSKFTEYYRDIEYDISFSILKDGDGDGIEDDVLFHTKKHMIQIHPRPDSIVHDEIIPENSAIKILKEVYELEEQVKNKIDIEKVQELIKINLISEVIEF